MKKQPSKTRHWQVVGQVRAGNKFWFVDPNTERHVINHDPRPTRKPGSLSDRLISKILDRNKDGSQGHIQ